MAKTAEEILKDTLTKKAVELNEPVEDDEWEDWKEEQGPEFMQVLDESHKAFAAQEVEAYKKRLEDRLTEHFNKHVNIYGFDLRTIIDAVK